MTITEIITKAKAGCKESKDRLITLFHDRIQAKCLVMVKDPDIARDILLEVFHIFNKKVSSITGNEEADVLKWLLATCKMVKLNHLKAKSPRMELIGAEAENRYKTEQGSFNLVRKELDKALALLPEVLRKVFHLHVEAGYTHKEIGQILDIPEGTSSSYLKDARTMVRKIFKSNEKYYEKKSS